MSGATAIDLGHLKRRLEQTVRGEVRFDAGSRAIYANDSSNFRQVPLGVVVPETVEWCLKRRKGAGVADRDLDDRSLGELTKRLSEQTSTLLRQEMALARAEMQVKGKQFGIGGGLLGAAGLLGFFTLALLLASIVLVLIEVGIVAWLAGVIVTVATG